MNKTQLNTVFVVLAAGLAVFLVLFARQGRRNADYFVCAQSRSIGYDLVKRTNSPDIISMDSNFQQRLTEFLAQPADVETVILGDESPPLGNGAATTRLFLTNASHDRLAVRLKQKQGTNFSILGFWTPASPLDEQHSDKANLEISN